MATGFQNSGGTDFDNLFDPYVQGTKPAATGFQTSDGVDLRERYAPLEYGSKGANVGMQTAGGVDLSNLWAAKGTATYTIAGLNGRSFVVGQQAQTYQSSVSASLTLAMQNNGTWKVSGATMSGPVPISNDTGTWLPAGATVSQYEVRFEVVKSGSSAATTNNSAATFTSCSATQYASLSLPTAGGTSPLREASATIRVYLRRVGGTASETVLTFSVNTNGFQ